MPVKKLKQFLDTQGVKYVSMTHSPAFTAQEVAAKSHVPGRELAKTVIVKMDGDMAMVVLPASLDIDFDMLKDQAGVSRVELATEQDFKNMFPDCDTGAMPPFGNLYNMDVYVDKILTQDDEIAFNAGSHTELLKLEYHDFERLVKPKVIRFTHAAIYH